MPTWHSLSFQNSSSPFMEQLIFFHDHTMVVLILIMTLVGHIMVSLVVNSFSSQSTMESQMIEMVWTVIPAFILVTIGIPSLRILYLLDDISNPSLTLKTMGHQWYWSYEYSDFTGLEFDSYMLPQEEVGGLGGARLLEVDNRVPMPFNSLVRVIVSSTDVIHSWTIPSLGVKADATPGRLNQLSIVISRPGLFYGQCSEICGANHSFMPICVESVAPSMFLSWASKFSAL